MRRRSKPTDRALALLSDPSPEVRRTSVEAISDTLRTYGPGSHARRQIDRVFQALSKQVRTDPSEEVRRAIAYVLTFWAEQRAAWSLLPVLQDERESPVVRGQAAEGIGVAVSGRLLSAEQISRITDALAAGLRDPSPEVRFWCLYAVGQARLVSLRGEVERLRDSDENMCPYMWRVCDEASDVLTFFDTGVWPDRDFPETS